MGKFDNLFLNGKLDKIIKYIVWYLWIGQKFVWTLPILQRKKLKGKEAQKIKLDDLRSDDKFAKVRIWRFHLIQLQQYSLWELELKHFNHVNLKIWTHQKWWKVWFLSSSYRFECQIRGTEHALQADAKNQVSCIFFSRFCIYFKFGSERSRQYSRNCHLFRLFKKFAFPSSIYKKIFNSKHVPGFSQTAVLYL